MRSVRTDREIELEQEFVRLHALREVDEAVLSADLTELRRPERHERRGAVVDQAAVERAARSVIPSADVPPPRELVLREAVVAERGRVIGRGERQVLAAPDQLRPQVEPLIDR